MASDPRVSKPRLLKAYSDSQLTFLKSNLPEFERKLQGSVRGDAKKFALEVASDYMARFGLPSDFVGVEESDVKFREQIYNWFKNTTGRNRRKLEGRPKSSKKSAEKGQGSSNPEWNPIPTSLDSYISENIGPVGQPDITSYANVQQSPAPLPSPPALTPNVSQVTLRGAFLQGLDPSTLASMILNFLLSEPASLTPLTAVVDALFEAISSDPNSTRNPHDYLRRYLGASTYFTPSVVHAGVSGPMAGPRALQMQIRKFSTWAPNPASGSNVMLSPIVQSSSAMSITDEMHRIADDRQRKKDHIQWANIHAAALELGLLGIGHTGESINSGYAYAMGRAFSEMVARDAVWESDEVEWVAGICVLRAIIRTAMRGDRSQRDEYDRLLKTYEERWKEIKDEARQAFVTEVLLSAKDDIAKLEESLD